MSGFDDLARFALLLVRPGMLVVVVPFLGSAGVPALVRTGLVVMVALLLMPVVPVPDVASPAVLTIVVAREAAIGAALGLALRVLVAAAEFAGHFVGFSLGLSLGALIDPQSGVRNGLFAILYAQIAILAVLAVQAHHQVLRALAESYAEWPIGVGSVNASLGASVAWALGVVFTLGVRLAAPVVVVLLLTELALGLVGRVAPMLNVLIAGAPVRLVIGLLVAAATVSLMPQVIARHVSEALSLSRVAVEGFR